jgi:hypothetical protein
MVHMEHAGDGLRGPHRFGSPTVDRCAAQDGAQRQAACRRDRDAALAYVRHLMVDDQVCLEGNPLVDGVTVRCRVRAFVEDASPESIKLEIREAAPGASFAAMDDYWYHEAALVDLQLKSAGYALP